MESYVRRIQRTGKSTYTVSLPKSWVERMGLKRFDEVQIVEFERGLVKDQRILKSLNLSSPADCISYALAAKNIERAADHAENICRKVLSIRRAPRQDEKIVKLSAELVNVFRSSVNSLLVPDVFFADKTLRNAEQLAERIEQLQAQPGYESSAHQTVLGSLKRVAEYAADLSETAINLSGRAVTVTA
jgi:bifunctional DNA-binding transcriptional regulator/antitoxin component of YhaV-PrlF toxin-antitoxin module